MTEITVTTVSDASNGDVSSVEHLIANPRRDATVNRIADVSIDANQIEIGKSVGSATPKAPAASFSLAAVGARSAVSELANIQGASGNRATFGGC